MEIKNNQIFIFVIPGVCFIINLALILHFYGIIDLLETFQRINVISTVLLLLLFLITGYLLDILFLGFLGIFLETIEHSIFLREDDYNKKEAKILKYYIEKIKSLGSLSLSFMIVNLISKFLHNYYTVNKNLLTFITIHYIFVLVFGLVFTFLSLIYLRRLFKRHKEFNTLVVERKKRIMMKKYGL